jgi:hypothetical protein
MPRAKDISAARPAESFAVIHATPEMNAEATLLLTGAAYAWFDRAPACGTQEAKDLMHRAICTTFSALPDDVCVTEHFPEPYLVRFIFPHHRSLAVTKHDFLFGEHKIQVRPWRLEDHAEQVELLHHTRLCIEGVPLYTWNPLVVQHIVGRSCSLDYIEPSCVNKSFTKALCVWVWAESLALVPKVCWVTLPGPSGVAGVPERGRRGLQCRAIIHLDIVEDMSGPPGAPPPFPEKHSWTYGLIAGERQARDCTERITDVDVRRDRGRRDDDDDRDSRGRRGYRGWRDTIRRSLSRSAGVKGRDGDRRRQEGGRDRDRSGNRDGGRRRAGSAPPVLAGAAAPGGGRPALVPSAVLEAPTVEDASEDGDAEPLATGPRGRQLGRDATPRSTRRRSRAERTPPSTPDPPCSPTAVYPTSPSSKGSCPPVILLAGEGGSLPSRIQLTPFSAASASVGARRVLDFLAPSGLSASRSPGFSASPVAATSPVLSFGSSGHSVDASPTADSSPPLAPLFRAVPQTLLSPPPRRVANRRKTLAEMDVVRNVNYSLQRRSGRLKGMRKDTPVAKAAAAFVYRGLGIMQNGEEVTELAMKELAKRFDGEIPDHVLATLRDLFCVSSMCMTSIG